MGNGNGSGLCNGMLCGGYQLFAHALLIYYGLLRHHNRWLEIFQYYDGPLGHVSFVDIKFLGW